MRERKNNDGRSLLSLFSRLRNTPIKVYFHDYNEDSAIIGILGEYCKDWIELRSLSVQESTFVINPLQTIRQMHPFVILAPTNPPPQQAQPANPPAMLVRMPTSNSRQPQEWFDHTPPSVSGIDIRERVEQHVQHTHHLASQHRQQASEFLQTEHSVNYPRYASPEFVQPSAPAVSDAPREQISGNLSAGRNQLRQMYQARRKDG